MPAVSAPGTGRIPLPYPRAPKRLTHPAPVLDNHRRSPSGSTLWRPSAATQHARGSAIAPATPMPVAAATTTLSMPPGCRAKGGLASSLGPSLGTAVAQTRMDKKRRPSPMWGGF